MRKVKAWVSGIFFSIRKWLKATVWTLNLNPDMQFLWWSRVQGQKSRRWHVHSHSFKIILFLFYCIDRFIYCTLEKALRNWPYLGHPACQCVDYDYEIDMLDQQINELFSSYMGIYFKSPIRSGVDACTVKIKVLRELVAEWQSDSLSWVWVTLYLFFVLQMREGRECRNFDEE